MKKKILLFYLLIFSNLISSQNIVINEIMSSNTFSIVDDDGTYQDWIELYNAGPTSINLSGYGLTDDSTLLFKWVFPNVTIDAGDYLLIWASEKNRTEVNNPLHTNFKISASGNPLLLTSSSGILVSSIAATAIPPDVSYGRFPNATGALVYFQMSTPEAINNSAGFSEFLNPPSFSQTSGFFTANFNLLLSTSTPGASIIYSLDGSDPDENNLSGTTYSFKNQYPELPGQATGSLLQKSFQTLQYTSPIPIFDRTVLPNKLATISSTYAFSPTYFPTNLVFKGSVVRAKLVKPGALPSKISSATYFVSPLGTGRFSLPVVSLTLSENKLFDYTDGIFVAGIDFDSWRTANPTSFINYDEDANYIRTGLATEKRANLSYFVNGNEVINQEVGLRIHGGTTRAFQSKAFSVYARSEYGSNSLDYKFFPDVADISFKRIVLRNSGGDFENTMFRDALNQELVKSLHAETEAYQPSIVFVNGEYWGILNLREKYDDNYFSRVHNIWANELDFIEDEGWASEGDDLDYTNLKTYFQNTSLVSDGAYSYIKTRIDPENFIDYFTANIFMQNSDWPGTNIQCWRKKTTGYVSNAPYGHDGRWRWVFHDMDDTFSFGTSNFAYNNLAAATAVGGTDWPNPDWSTLFLRRLLENNSFKIDFINRFADLLNTNFLSNLIISKIDQMKSVIQPEMNEHISRWKSIEDLNEWNYYIDYEKAFANARPAFQRDHIRSQFNISSNINATLNVTDYNHGFIKINTINVADGTPGIEGNPYPWNGIYFHNIPVKLVAVPKPGYVFSYWSGASTSTNPEITITPTADFSITAHFGVDPNYESAAAIYFWMMDDAIANNAPLESLNATFELTSNAVINYQSCLVGYPFSSANVNWRKAAMERRNKPTPLNYRSVANGNLPYDVNSMRGIQIKEPFQSGTLENQLVLSVSTLGYKKIKVSFAALNELTGVTGIAVDYATNSGTPLWTSEGLTTTNYSLASAYQLYTIDFENILAVNNNPDFKIRLRFIGTNLTADSGNRVTFNNIAVDGVAISLASETFNQNLVNVIPNPFDGLVTIVGFNEEITYAVYSIDGKKIDTGTAKNNQIDFSTLAKGVYLLRLNSKQNSCTKKIIKQ
jgi:uncharacterized repeat protein (TIGR02543 family)